MSFPARDLEPVLRQVQVMDHFRVEEADRVARGRVAEVRVEFFGGRGPPRILRRCMTPESPLLARYQMQVRPLRPPPTITTSKRVFMLDLDKFTVYKSSALILL